MEFVKDLVSVIVPVYNGQEHLKRCIDSILGQTYSKIELILVDNYSTDQSFEICNEYAKRDHRVVVVRQDRRWVSAVRNKGLESMTGEYCCFCDQDDVYAPYMLERLYQMMQQEQVDLASCNYCRKWEDGTIKTDRRVCGGDYSTPDDKSKMMFILNDILEVKLSFCVWNKMFRSDIIREHNITFEERLRICEDLGFFVNYACYGRRTIATAEIMYDWYQYATSASEFERSGSICLNDFTYAFEHVYENIKSNHAMVGMQKKFYIVFMKAMDYQYRKAMNADAIKPHKDIVLRDFYFGQLKKVIIHPIQMYRYLGKNMAILLWKRSVFHMIKSRK